MKAIKRLLTVVLAFVMSLTVALFSACNLPPKGDNGDDKGNTGNNGDNTGNNGDNTGDNTGDNDNPNTPDVTVGYEGSTKEATALVNAMLAQQTEQAGFTMESKVSQSGTKFKVDKQGEKINGTDEAYTGKDNQDISANINLKTGDGNISYKDTYKDEYDEEAETVYNYFLLRSWHLFAYGEYDEETGESKPVTSFADKTLYWQGSILDQMSVVTPGGSGLEDLLGDKSLGEYAGNLLVPAYGATVAALADQLGALTIENGKATADLNLAAYNLVQKVTTVLNKVTKDTTIGDFLAFPEVKGLITALTAGITGEQVKTYLTQAITAYGEMPVQGSVTLNQMLEAMKIDISKLLVAAGKDDTAYDYIVKLVSSNELKNVLNTVLTAIQSAQPTPPATIVTVPATLNNMTLDFFLQLGGLSVDSIKALVTAYTSQVTATEFKVTTSSNVIELKVNMYDKESEDSKEVLIGTVPYATSETVTVKNVKMEYTLDGNKVTAQKFTMEETDAYKKYWGSYWSCGWEGNVPVDVHINDVTIKQGSTNVSVAINLQYPADAYTLDDVSGNTIIYENYEWTDACNGKTSNLYIHLNNDDVLGGVDYVESVDLEAVLSVADGKVTGVSLKYREGNAISIAKDGSFDLTVKGHVYDDKDITEKTGTVKLYLNWIERDREVLVVITTEPVELNEYSEVETIGSATIDKATVYYTNTVSGIISKGHASSTVFNPMGDAD